MGASSQRDRLLRGAESSGASGLEFPFTSKLASKLSLEAATSHRLFLLAFGVAPPSALSAEADGLTAHSSSSALLLLYLKNTLLNI